MGWLGGFKFRRERERGGEGSGHTDCKQRRRNRNALRDKSNHRTNINTRNSAHFIFNQRRDDDRDGANSSSTGCEDSKPVKLARPFQHDAADECTHDRGDSGWDQAGAGLCGGHVQYDLEVKGQVEYQSCESGVEEEIMDVACEKGFVENDVARRERFDCEARFDCYEGDGQGYGGAERCYC